VGVGAAAGGRRHSHHSDAGDSAGAGGGGGGGGAGSGGVCRDLDGAESAVAIQFFDREDNIPALVASLRSNATGRPEILVNNDSNRGHRAWMTAFRGCGRCLVVYAPDLHEIRAYNRMAGVQPGLNVQGLGSRA
jgi:hypothetical protein